MDDSKSIWNQTDSDEGETKHALSRTGMSKHRRAMTHFLFWDALSLSPARLFKEQNKTPSGSCELWCHK